MPSRTLSKFRMVFFDSMTVLLAGRDRDHAIRRRINSNGNRSWAPRATPNSNVLAKAPINVASLLPYGRPKYPALEHRAQSRTPLPVSPRSETRAAALFRP
jgi:hypothetical protein